MNLKHFDTKEFFELKTFCWFKAKNYNVKIVISDVYVFLVLQFTVS